MSSEYKFFAEVNKNFDKAAALTTYPKGLLDQIKFCNSVYKITFPLRKRRRKYRNDLCLESRTQSS